MTKRQGGFAKGTVVGAIIGAVAALLLAPKSGKETQADIKRRAKGVKRDIEQVVDELSRDLVGRIDDLKDAAKDLKGEALEESEELVQKAEDLKRDLQSSASNLAKVGGEAKSVAVDDARRLVDEGSAVMTELERVTKKLMGSARDRWRQSRNGD